MTGRFENRESRNRASHLAFLPFCFPHWYFVMPAGKLFFLPRPPGFRCSEGRSSWNANCRLLILFLAASPLLKLHADRQRGRQAGFRLLLDQHHPRCDPGGWRGGRRRQTGGCSRGWSPTAADPEWIKLADLRREVEIAEGSAQHAQAIGRERPLVGQRLVSQRCVADGAALGADPSAEEQNVGEIWIHHPLEYRGGTQVQ